MKKLLLSFECNSFIQKSIFVILIFKDIVPEGENFVSQDMKRFLLETFHLKF